MTTLFGDLPQEAAVSRKAVPWHRSTTPCPR